jgi:putative aldouronate transport system permease protein
MVKLSRGERIFEVLNYTLLILLTLIFIIPLLSVFANSLVGQDEYVRRGAFILLPQHPDLNAYRLLLWRGSVVVNAYAVTLFRVVVGTFLNLCFTATLAYVLARPNLPGRTPMTMFVFVTMIFSGGLIPSFVLMDTLGLLNSLWVMILPGLISPWNMLIMRNFFMSLPVELEEAAIVDGAGPLTILLKVVLPLSLPVIATVGLFYAVAHWNAWFDAAIYIKDLNKMPVQVILRGILQQAVMLDPEAYTNIQTMPPNMAVQSAMVVVSTLPILIAYPFVQKYFVKGALVGSVKG